jgi:hypothetical protein
VDEAQELALFLGQHWLCLGSAAVGDSVRPQDAAGA